MHQEKREIIPLTEEEARAINEEYISEPTEDCVCVDGRDERSGKISRPGGSAGYLLVVLGAMNRMNINSELKKDALKIVLENLGKFGMHSDTHDSTGKIAGGCGHIKFARNNSPAYSLTDEDIEIFDETIVPLQSSVFVLPGDHEERGLIITNNKLKHNGAKGQIFVYNKKEDENMLETLANTIGKTLDLNINDLLGLMKQVSDLQTKFTVQKLVSDKNLPIFDLTT